MKEVAAIFDRTPEAVRVAANNNRLPHDVVLRGSRKERRFPKDEIDRLDRWPGYAPSARSATAAEHGLDGEVARLRAENAQLLRQLDELHTARALAEMRIDSLSSTVARQGRALRALVETLSAEPDPGDALRSVIAQEAP